MCINRLCGIYKSLSFVFAVHGNYSDWSDFMACSVTCGGGKQYKTRTCDNPPPQHGGNNCSKLGLSRISRPCNTQNCPGMKNNYLANAVAVDVVYVVVVAVAYVVVVAVANVVVIAVANVVVVANVVANVVVCGCCC